MRGPRDGQPRQNGSESRSNRGEAVVGRALRLYLSACAVIAAVAVLFPVARAFSAGLLGLLSVSAIVFAIVHRRPTRVRGWWLLAVAVGLMSVGSVLVNAEASIYERPPEFPDAADILLITSYAPLALALLDLGRPRQASRDWLLVLDTVAIGVAVSLPAWLLLIRPAVTSLNLGTLGKILAVASWVGLVAVFAATVRVCLVWRTNRALNLVSLGVAAFLIGDVVYGLNLIHGTWRHVALIDLGYGLFVVLCGAAALTRSMCMLSSDAGPSPSLGFPQVVVVAAALLIAPGILLVEATPGPVTTGWAIGLAAATVGIVVVARLVLAHQMNRSRTRRESAMRDAVRALVEASTITEVGDCLQTALTTMLTPRSASNVKVRHRVTPTPVPTDPATGSLVVPVVSAGAAGNTAPDDVPLDIVFVAPRAELEELKPSLLVLSDQAIGALDRIELTRRLRGEERERYLRTLVLTSTDATLISRGGRIDYATPSATTIFGRDVEGEHFDDVVRRTGSGGVPGGEAWPADVSAAEGYVNRPDGARMDVVVHRRDLSDDPTVNGVVSTMRDVTAERRLQEDLAYRATHDALTGLANAQAFGDELQGEAARRRERRVSDSSGLAAIFVDLDEFKDVNDTYGHHMGDQLLAEVARRITACLREGDFAARLGGDEFAALLRGVPGEAAAQSIAQRIVDELSRPIVVGDVSLSGQASVGLAHSPMGRDVDTLIRNADTALYNAKAQGKGRWRQYHDGMVNPIRQHVDARRRVEDAIENGRLAVHYQPIVELATGVPVGFEALVRMDDAQGSMPSAELIAVAEQTGLIERLGEFVLRRALADSQTLASGHSRYVSVNLSAPQIRQPEFVAKVRSHLSETHTNPTSLVLEITENILVADGDRAWAHLAMLREDGVRTAIDGYGSGYASLGYLRQPVIDIVKIDRSFLVDVRSGRNLRLIRAISDLCRDLGLDAVAEGVHDAASRAALLSVGCKYGQGFYYARALPLDEAVSWSAQAATNYGP